MIRLAPLLLLVGCVTPQQQRPVTVQWANDEVRETGHLSETPAIQWGLPGERELGFGSDGVIHWRTNTFDWDEWLNLNLEGNSETHSTSSD